MSSIGQGAEQIHQKYEIARAKNLEKNDDLRQATEVKKEEAAKNKDSVFNEVNTNHSDTATGAFKEFGHDVMGAMGALIKENNAQILDVIVDTATNLQENAYNMGSYISEDIEVAGQVAGDVASGVAQVGSDAASAVADAAKEAGGAAQQAAKGVLHSAGEAVGNAASAVADTAKEAGGAAEHAVKGPLHSAGEAASNLIDNIAQSFQKGVDKRYEDA